MGWGQKTPPEPVGGGQRWGQDLGRACAAGHCGPGRGRGKRGCYRSQDGIGLLSETETSGREQVWQRTFQRPLQIAGLIG